MSTTIKVDTSALSKAVAKKLEKLQDAKPFLRIIAFDLLVMITERIHEKGLDANGKKLGVYGNAYLRVRMQKYKRSSDPNMILSLTRQLENDWTVGETEKGWGIGLNNPFNANKLLWNQERLNVPIAALSKEELKYAQDKMNALIEETLRD